MPFKLLFVSALFLLVGCSSNEDGLVDGDQHITEEIHAIISDYIVAEKSDGYYPTEKQFEVHKIYGTREQEDELIVYMWSYYAGFDRATKTEIQAGHSLPAVVTLQRENDRYNVLRYEEPLDGAYWVESIEEMFPEKYAKKILRASGNPSALDPKMMNKVKAWLKEEE